MLVHPVVSIEYEVATYIIKSMLQKGLISKKEYEKIDEKNRQTFIGEFASKGLAIPAY